MRLVAIQGETQRHLSRDQGKPRDTRQEIMGNPETLVKRSVAYMSKLIVQSMFYGVHHHKVKHITNNNCTINKLINVGSYSMEVC